MAKISINDLPDEIEIDMKDMKRILGGNEILSELILGYLARNPAAEDSLGGITNWWKSANMITIKTRRCDHGPN